MLMFNSINLLETFSQSLKQISALKCIIYEKNNILHNVKNIISNIIIRNYNS